MPLRFRRIINIVPGLRLNLSKKSGSISVGKPGASLNLGTKGIYSNVGLPGSGLSYRSQITGNASAKKSASKNDMIIGVIAVCVVLCCLCLVGLILIGNINPNPTPTATLLLPPTESRLQPVVPIIQATDTMKECDCSDDLYNCDDFSSQSAAQSCFNYCQEIKGADIHNLDRDGNGSACESNPN